MIKLLVEVSFSHFILCLLLLNHVKVLGIMPQIDPSLINKLASIIIAAIATFLAARLISYLINKFGEIREIHYRVTRQVTTFVSYLMLLQVELQI